MVKRGIFAICDEVFADGTNVDDELGAGYTGIADMPDEWLQWARNPRRGRKIKANPGAAEVWLMERQNGAPWREKAERIQQIEDEKVKREMISKKLSQLAKQVCRGMSTTYNAHYDPSELIPLLVGAYKQVQKGKPDAQASALIKAVNRFDLKGIQEILSCYDKTPPPTPSLSISIKR